MNSSEIKRAANKSVKWSFFGELFAKIATPLSTMILARLLSPTIYGIATAAVIIVSFCETVSENAFSRFIIQHDFKDEEEYRKYFSVSFFTSLILSILLCAAVFALRFPLSKAVGNSGYELVLVVSCLQIPFAAVNALYSADLKRRFGFRKLFYIRIVFCVVPFIVTVPLAFFGFGYWALVVGAIAGQVIECPFLILSCKRNLKAYFSWEIFKETFRCSLPIILESTVIWFCTWTGTIIAANYFNSEIVGLVKVSSSTVNSIFALFATTFTSVLFPALSRLKNDKESYQNTFYSIQGAALSILIPLGIGIFFYSKLVTNIFLGEKWQDAAFIISIYSLTKPLMLTFNNFMSEVFRSKGHFYSSMFYQIAMLVFDLLLKLTIGRISFEWFIWTTVFSNLFTTALAILILKFRYGFSIRKQGKSLFPSLLCSALMIPLILLGTATNAGLAKSIGQVIMCIVLYFSLLHLLFPAVFQNTLSYISVKRNENN